MSSSMEHMLNVSYRFVLLYECQFVRTFNTFIVTITDINRYFELVRYSKFFYCSIQIFVPSVKFFCYSVICLLVIFIVNLFTYVCYFHSSVIYLLSLFLQLQFHSLCSSIMQSKNIPLSTPDCIYIEIKHVNLYKQFCFLF